MTNDPLKLLVSMELYSTPEVQALIQQGHLVEGVQQDEVDAHLGSKCWRMTPELIKYLPMAIKAIRKEKKDAGKPRGPKVKKARKPKQEVLSD